MLQKLFLTSILLLAPFASTLRGAPATPNCIASIAFDTANQTTQIDNRVGGCYSWALQYSNSGFSAISIVVQAAPDNAGVPGAWSTFQSLTGGTLVVGSNPSTVTSQALITLTGPFPWVRVLLSSKTGNGVIKGVLYGNQLGADAVASAGGGGGGGCTAPCVVIGNDAAGVAPTAAPVAMAGLNAAGLVTPQTFCTSHAPISVSASGNTQIIALSASKSIRICSLSLTPASAIDIKLTQGTGSNCATGVADLIGLYQQVTALALDWPTGPLQGTISNAVCLNLSSAVSTTGTVTYAQY